MSSTPFMALRHCDSGSTPAQIYRYTGTTRSAEGNTFGTTYESNVYPQYQACRTVRGFGLDEIYLIFKEEIYKYTGSGTPTVVKSLPNPNLTVPYADIVWVNDNGTAKLLVLYRSATGSAFALSKSADGSSWSDSSPALGYGYCGEWGIDVINNVAFWLGTASGALKFQSYDVTTGTASDIDLSSVGPKNPCHVAAQCMLNGRHYLFLVKNSDSTGRIYEWDGVSLTDRSGSLGVSFGSTSEKKSAMFVDPNDDSQMILFANLGGGNGFRAWKLAGAGNGTITPTNITSSVLPSALQSAPDASRMEAIIDTEANPGGPPDVYLYYAPGWSGQQYSEYAWHDVDTLIGSSGSPDSTGGDAQDAIVSFNLYGGKLFYTGTQPVITILSGPVAVEGGEQITFRCNRSGGGNLDVRFYFSTDGENPEGECTLYNPSQGSLDVTGKIIEGVPGDGTSTTVVWRNTVDGVPNATDGVKLAGSASVP